MSHDQLAKTNIDNSASGSSLEQQLQSSLEQIGGALRGLKFGSVNVIVQGGVVVQIDRTEKVRLSRWRTESRRRQSLIVIMVCSIATTIGCSQGETRLPTHKVTGKVIKNGIGVPHVTVIFHFKNPPEGFIKPRAISNADGVFNLTTYDSGDGAPVGEYDITVEQWLNDNPQVGPTNRLPEKFGSPGTSGIKATVASTENLLSPFVVR